MYCRDCGHEITLLGLLDKETKDEQYLCTNCNTVWLKNKNGIIFKKNEISQ